jgi:hypothetical protein
MSPQFWLDANVLIEAHNRSYPINRAITFWSRLAEQVENGAIGSPRRVYKEVAEHEEHQDEVAKWVKVRKNGLCRLPTLGVTDKVGEIETYVWGNAQYDHAEVWQFCKGGDPWVIAHAAVEGGNVVTLETALRPNSKKPRVPDVADIFGVRCVTTLGMFGLLGITF